MKKKAIVLLSGGLDSATTLAIAKKEGYEIYAITFNYGQKHSIELNSAKKVANFFKVKKHTIIDIDLKIVGGSLLIEDAVVDVSTQENSDIPLTYVPARNTIFLSYALAFAETLEAGAIFIGANQVDYSGYPDCREEYLKAFEKMANLATKMGISGNKIKIVAPLLHLTKDKIIKEGIKLGLDYSLTHSCYFPTKEGNACGVCDSCILRKKGFSDAKLTDPITYDKDLCS